MKAASDKPDLIIADALMPIMDGFQLLIQLKKSKPLRSIIFIFYSATYTDERDVQFGLSLGAEAYIVKPKDPVELWQEIEDIVLKAEGNKKSVTTEPIEEEGEYLERYSEMVALKLEHKISLLEKSERAYKRLSEELSQTVKELTEYPEKIQGLD